MTTTRYVCVLLCILATNIAAENFTITPITTSSGLYYEHIGEVLLSNDNWQFVTSVDYQGYLLFYEYLFTQASKIQQFCEKLSLKECDDRYDSIRSNLKRIEETDESMANFLGITKKPRRAKRFWGAIGNFFSSVGRGIASIFGGGSSQVDLSAYDRQIGDLRNGQRELQNELNQQRTLFLLDSERKNFQIEWLKKTQGEIQNKVVDVEKKFQKDSEQKAKEIKGLKNMLEETQEKLKMQEEIQKKLVSQVDKIKEKLLKVDKDINIINKKIENNTKKINQLELKVELNTISVNFHFLMDQFETEQKTLFGVIKNANRGELDPYILTPLNLIQMLQDIYPKLPDQMKFPFFPNIENAKNLYNLIKPSVYLYNSKIIFILQIPLVHSKIYSIHKITSLPVPVGNNKFAFILPQEPFLIIDNNYQEYILFSIDDLKDFCKEVSKNTYLCKQVHQISLAYSNQDCEVALFKTSKDIPDSCNTRLMHLDKSIFLQLQESRSWIYVIPSTEIVIFNCGNERLSKHLEGAGFIQLGVECNVRTFNFRIESLAEFSRPVQSNYSSPVDLKKFIDISQVEKFDKKTSIRRQIIDPFDFDELNKISFTLKNSDTNLAGLYYSLLAVAIILISIFGYLVYKKKIDLNNVLSRIRMRNSPRTVSSSANQENDGLQIRLKVNKNDDKIKKLSIRQDPSTSDPDSEYLTVRIKVKKEQPEQATQPEKLNIVNNTFPPLPEKPNNKEGNYLKELRKLKPKKVNV